MNLLASIITFIIPTEVIESPDEIIEWRPFPCAKTVFTTRATKFAFDSWPLIVVLSYIMLLLWIKSILIPLVEVLGEKLDKMIRERNR